MEREQWKSQLGFLFAAIGSAVGLGNIWRFSYQAYEHGGGAFLIPYLVALVTCGIPLIILEFAIGHKKSGSAPLAFAKINRRAEFFGWWPVSFVMFGIVLYYMVIIAWCLNYCIFSATMAWGSDPNSFFFQGYLGLSDKPFEIGGINLTILVTTAVVWFINWFIVCRGIGKGVELANKIFMPTLFLLTVFLIFYAITLDGAVEGVIAYLEPDFQEIMDVTVWISAYSQIFFSMSVGFGIMVAYASYLPDDADISRNAIMTGLGDSVFAVVAGLGVFAVLGFMAKSSGLPISEVVTESIGLAFVAYPKALSVMPGGNIFGMLFFFSLVVAGISSSISILEAFCSAIIDKFGVRREFVVTSVCMLGFLGSAAFTTNAGLYWLDIVDHFITHYGLIVVGIVECVLAAWFYDIRIFRRHVNRTSSIKIPRIWDLTIRFFVPAILAVVLAMDLITEFSKPYGGYPYSALILIGIDWLLFTLILAALFTKLPWKYDYMLHSREKDENSDQVR